jgi:hypothetical protein
MTCANCGAEAQPGQACPNCGTLQPAAPGQASGAGWGSYGPSSPGWGGGPGQPPQQQPYYPLAGQPYYGGYGPGAPFQQKTNGMAVASLVCSVLGLFCGVGAVVGVILGFVARGQIRRSAGAQKGEGLATAGIVVGFVVIALGILVAVIIAVSANSGTSS